MIHYLPLHYMFNNNIRDFSLETLVITYFIYTLYLGYISKDIYSVYIIDEHPKDIKEIITSIVYNKLI